MKHKFCVICIVAFCSFNVLSQKTGDLCRMVNGVRGVCLPITECADAVNKAINGEAPNLCNYESELLIVCCTEARTQIQPLDNPLLSRERTHYGIPGTEYYTVQNVPNSHSRERVDRFPRDDKPWWLAENSFVGNSPRPRPPQRPPKPQPPSDNLDTPWWLQDKPFNPELSKPVLLPPTIPPAPPNQTPPPVTRPHRPQKPTTTWPTTSNQRISEKKCNEYSKVVVDQIAALPLLPSPEPVQIDVPKCDFSSLELIVGGEEAKLKEFPHMAALGYRDGGNIEWRCGGSLISEYFVLTAAHCSSNRDPPVIARLGELNLKRNDDGAAPVNYGIEERIRHPNYKPPAKYNDIALLRLDRRVQFNDFIRPACLYNRNTFHVNKTVATGWGKIEFAEKQSDTLLKVVISIIDNKICNELYELDGPSKELPRGLSSSMMCAGELAGGKDTCQGDSGGPIQITRQNNQCVYSIVGITSFGKFCAAKNAPGVYTRVSSYIPWIESVVWPDE